MTNTASATDGQPAKSVQDSLTYGENVLTLSFGDACKVMKMDRNYEISLIFNCSQQITAAMVKANPDLIAIAGRVEETPAHELLGRMVYYRARPEEFKDPQKLQNTVNALYQKWTQPQP
ncbi:MAG: hypothetical protein KJ667_02925 [Alphaproteobacteria bacterium]|nr:hypothetical protein [Alphaproteobacteria bacterium]